MIITRTPLRISLGGGGTDHPSYYSQREGFVLSAAIDKYIFIGINRTFSDDYTIKYSAMERVPTIDDIRHPIVREVLAKHRSEGMSNPNIDRWYNAGITSRCRTKQGCS